MKTYTDSILLVDDEAHVISALKRALSEEDYEVAGAGGGEEALKLMAERRFKVVVSDEMMPGMDGAAFLAAVKERYPETVRMMLTGHASIEATMRAVNRGEIYRFFVKPWDELELKQAIRSALEKYDLEDENRRLLRTIKRQSQEFKYLEKNYPGITDLRKDASGAIQLDVDVTDDELAVIIAQCNKWY